MNNPNTEIKRWGIIVIQSLYPNDVKTGENLYKDILQYKNCCQKEAFSSFYNVQSIQEFRSVVKKVADSLIEGDILTLQIETHGCDEGIGLSNGELLRWKDFYNIIRPLNIKIGHLLFVVMSMCKSIAMISAIAPEKRAPYRAFVCTARNMYPDELYRGFLAFYDKYFNILDIKKALFALQEEVKDSNGYSPFQILSAESVYDDTFNPNRIFTEVVDNQLERINVPITKATRDIMSNSLRALFSEIHDRFYDYYNFKDRY